MSKNSDIKTKKEIRQKSFSELLGTELCRVENNERLFKVLLSTVGVLITVAAATVLLSFLLFPVLRIHGMSMQPTFNKGDIVVSVKLGNADRGDTVAFYYGNKVLVKRCIAVAGDLVNIDVNGNVFVNGALLDEPYITQKSFGECDIELPCQVPENRIFVLGDERESSIDSRNTAVGCISQEQIIGKIVFRIWPVDKIQKYD